MATQSTNKQIQYEIVTCSTQEDLDNHISAWNLLLIESPQKSPMLSHAWVSSFFQHRLARTDTWFVLIALGKGTDTILGVLPLVATPVKVIGLNKTLLWTPNDPHTMGGDFLLSGRAPPQLFEELLNAAEKRVPDCYMLKLTRVAEQSPSLELVNKLQTFHCHIENTGVGYHYPTVGDFEEYHAGLSKKFRGNLRRAENNLRKKMELTLVVEEGAEAGTSHMQEFLELEASGWKGRSGSAINKSEELLAFYTTLTKRLVKSQMLRWELLYGDKQLLAANYSVRFGGTVVIWKLGYDESLGKYSPGGLLFKLLLQEAYENSGIDEFNLMSDTPWQQNWKPQVRQYYDIRIYPRNLVSTLLCYLPEAFKAKIRRSSVLMSILRRASRLLRW